MLTHPLPKHVDPYKMADHTAIFEGTLPVSSFERLVEGLLSDSGTLSVKLEFLVGDDGFRELIGSVGGDVDIQCQRCMEPMRFHLSADIHLAFAFHEEMAKTLPKHLDAVVCTPDEHVELVELIQDDLILNLPQFAKHPEGACQIQTVFADPGNNTVIQDEEKSNPFSILAQIKSPGDDN